MISLGIYEKALPHDLTWEERLELVRKLGFNFLELSIDESDERLARLDWPEDKIKEVRDAIWKTKTPIYTMMLSGHRRYPLGSKDIQIRTKALDMMNKAIRLAGFLGIRNIQLAGYDVFYEEKTVLSRELFVENLTKAVEMAAAQQVTLAIETMDDPFINSLSKVKYLKSQIKSPWLQAYPDLGNISAWPENNIAQDLEENIENVVSIHLKDTVRVTADFPGKFKDVPFGEGCVDFKGCLRTMQRLGYNGTYTIEMWSQARDNPVAEVKEAKQFFTKLFDELGIKQRKVAD